MAKKRPSIPSRLGTPSVVSVDSVAVGVVTYNPDLERLKENLAAILLQVEYLYVFDNCSSNIEEIRGLLNTLGCPFGLIESDSNKGIAVALNVLARTAREDGYTHLILLDQDSVVSSNMVETLVLYADDDVAIVGPQIRDRNVVYLEEFNSEVFPIAKVITSGALLNLSIHQVVGGYDERLFVDLVDDEYCYNARLHGYKIMKCNETYITHELGDKERVMPFVKWEEGEGPKICYLYRSNHALWRRKDIGRSAAILFSTYRGTPLNTRIHLSLGKYFFFAVILEKQKLGVIKETFKGFNEGRKVAKALCRNEA